MANILKLMSPMRTYLTLMTNRLLVNNEYKITGGTTSFSPIVDRLLIVD